ncbi:ribonuclease HI, partial [Nocardia farcinica]|nr:ribonuclease HI [Nocardia farcinica]
GRPGPVRFRWVRGHVGNYVNERADALAGDAARKAAAAPAEPASEIAAAPVAVPQDARTSGKAVASAAQTLTLF